MCVFICRVFFFKQKTAYEMRISDWSSDVCSSDLLLHPQAALHVRVGAHGHVAGNGGDVAADHGADDADAAVDVLDVAGDAAAAVEIGRASCRERVCQYV